MEWIKVSERLPDLRRLPNGDERSSPVLVCGQKYETIPNHPVMAVCIYEKLRSNGKVWLDDWEVQGAGGYDWESTIVPTHWQPLTSPPLDKE